MVEIAALIERFPFIFHYSDSANDTIFMAKSPLVNRRFVARHRYPFSPRIAMRDLSLLGAESVCFFLASGLCRHRLDRPGSLPLRSVRTGACPSGNEMFLSSSRRVTAIFTPTERSGAGLIGCSNRKILRKGRSGATRGRYLWRRSHGSACPRQIGQACHDSPSRGSSGQSPRQLQRTQ